MDALSRIIRHTTASTRLPRSLSTGVGFLRRQLWVWPLVAAAMLALAGLKIRSDVESAARKELEEGLKATLQSNVEALTVWLENEQAAAVAMSNDIELRRLATELKRLAATADMTALAQSDLHDDFRRTLRPVLAGKHFTGYVLMDQDRLILTADRQELIGQIRSTNYELVQRVIEHGSTVTPPLRSAVLMRDGDGEMRAGQATMFAMAAQRDLTGDVIGALGLRIKPDEDFVRILQIARPGETGDTFAFDANGLLLSESRFTTELKRMGLVPDQPGARSQLTLELRDPGVNLKTGKRPERTRSEQPLTVMATSAIAGNEGVNVTGYRDARGVPVVGAWKWLDDYGMGVATEKEVAEAFHSLYILRRAFWFLFSLLAASSGLILLFSLAMDRMQKAAQRATLQAKELGQYQLEEKLGEGGMGVVYRGRHRLLRRPTAIKLLHPDKTTDEAIARFEREVQLTCQLNHPNTIVIYDYGRTPDGLFFYAMEYLDGIDLDTLVTRYGPLPEGRVIHILRKICGSLAEAHEINLVHRDIKPANIVLGRRGGDSDVVKVLDFGLVKAVDAGRQSTLTSAGSMVGTPLYMPPEAIENPDRVDARSDLYSVAALGYFLLTGTPPFEGRSVIEICMHHSRTTPKPPSERLKKPVSAELEAALLKGLAKNPNDRFATAHKFAEALADCAAAREWNHRAAENWWKSITTGVKPSASSSNAGIDQAVTIVLASLSEDGSPR